MDLVRIMDHGNSKVIALPRRCLNALRWIKGDRLIVEIVEDGIRLTRMQPHKAAALNAKPASGGNPEGQGAPQP